MRSIAITCALAAVGCRGLLGIEEADVAASDAAGDGALTDVTPDGSLCYGVLHRICPLGLPPGPLVFTAGVTEINTNMAVGCTLISLSNGAEACLVHATDITIPKEAEVTVIGARPLVLLATGTLLIVGTLDHLSGPLTVSHCGGGVFPLDAAGGAGGSLGTAGGAGGPRATAEPGSGVPGPTTVASALVSGCAGQASGAANGGLGGGGILAIAERIEVDGIINVSGRGGRGGMPPLIGTAGGGGGGGSGGMIVLEATMIYLTPSSGLMANGGGGGGGTSSAGQTGGTGGVAAATSPSSAAPGGVPSGIGAGAGGNGGTSGVGAAGQAAESTTAGAGGGGGGAGIIWLRGSLVAVGIVSPPPRLN